MSWSIWDCRDQRNSAPLCHSPNKLWSSWSYSSLKEQRLNLMVRMLCIYLYKTPLSITQSASLNVLSFWLTGATPRIQCELCPSSTSQLWSPELNPWEPRVMQKLSNLSGLLGHSTVRPRLTPLRLSLGWAVFGSRITGVYELASAILFKMLKVRLPRCLAWSSKTPRRSSGSPIRGCSWTCSAVAFVRLFCY